MHCQNLRCFIKNFRVSIKLAITTIPYKFEIVKNPDSASKVVDPSVELFDPITSNTTTMVLNEL